YAHHLDLHSFPTRRSSDLPFYGLSGHGDDFTSAREVMDTSEQFGIFIKDPSIIQTCEFIDIHNNSLSLNAYAYDFLNHSVYSAIDRKSTRLNSSHVKISYA